MCIYTYILKFSELMSNHNSKSLKKMCVFISNIFDSHFSLNQYSLVSHWTRIYTVCLRLHELQVSICLEYCLYLSILCFVLRPCHQSIVLFPIFQLHISAFFAISFLLSSSLALMQANKSFSECKSTHLSRLIKFDSLVLKKINMQVWLSYIHQVERGITSRCVWSKIIWIH